MGKMEIRNEVKMGMAERIMAAFPDATLIEDYTYAVPCPAPAESGLPIMYAKLELSVPNWYDTKSSHAFNLDSQVAAYQEVLNERAEKAAEAARKVAEKEAKRKAS